MARPETLALPGGRRLDLRRPLVMAILNATPDSFSDGGRLPNGNALEAHVRRLLDEGADILDVGGESTRPGHVAVAEAEELRRVLPVIAAIRRVDADVPISIDTRKGVVAAAALAAGASIVNNVGAFDAAMAKACVASEAPVVVMRSAPCGGDVLQAAAGQLRELLATAQAAGIASSRLIVDPGLGFGDPPGGDVEANLALLDGVPALFPDRAVLVGASRKRFVGTLMGEPVAERRVAGSVEMAVRAVRAGASIVRVHDVAETVAALRP